jgi:dihydroflavonol-4-reductase
MHVASPYFIKAADPQRDLVDPAVQGTLSVLAAAAGAGTVKRVVMTSSFVAIEGPPEGRVFTEADWNTTASLEYLPYSYSKTLAEREAWSFVESNQHGFDLVTINPTMVTGPSLVPQANQSHEMIISLTDGSQPAIVELNYPHVDVRDVALVHILAMENSLAHGRYLTTAGSMSPHLMAYIGRELGMDSKYRFPRLTLRGRWGARIARLSLPLQEKGTRDFLNATLGHTFVLDTTKVRTELGIVFRDLDETIRDTWVDLDRWGHLGKKPR